MLPQRPIRPTHFASRAHSLRRRRAGSTTIIASLVDSDSGVRGAAIEALGQFPGQQTVDHLLIKLSDEDIAVRLAAIKVLTVLRDERAVPPLLDMLNKEEGVETTVAAALCVFGEHQGTEAFSRQLTSPAAEIRMDAVHSFALLRDPIDERLLSRDVDAAAPWIDPSVQIAEEQVSRAAAELDIEVDEVRTLYEGMAADLKLTLGWRP